MRPRSTELAGVTIDVPRARATGSSARATSGVEANASSALTHRAAVRRNIITYNDISRA
jgi:hypothetical protein